jgi:hypothetical protein
MWDRLEQTRRDRVLRTPMVEFGCSGYSRASLEVIAREAGVAGPKRANATRRLLATLMSPTTARPLR